MNKIILIAALVILVSSQANASKINWPVSVSGTENHMMPLQGTVVSPGQKRAQIDPMESGFGDHTGYACFIERPNNGNDEVEWPSTRLEIDTFTISADFKSLPSFVTKHNGKIHSFPDRRTATAYMDTHLNRIIKKSSRQTKGRWILNLDLYGGGRARCQMPILPEDITFQSDVTVRARPQIALEAVPLKHVIETRARQVLTQFFLIKISMPQTNVLALAH